jgi:hypothetical protein
VTRQRVYWERGQPVEVLTWWAGPGPRNVLTQDLLGHTDPATTAGYAAWNQANGPAAVSALPIPPPGATGSGHLRDTDPIIGS